MEQIEQPAPMPTIPEKCPNCHDRTEVGARFCGNCGQALFTVSVSEPVMESVAEAVAAPVPAYTLPDPAKRKNESKAVVALILAIASFPSLLMPYVGIILAILAIVFARQARPLVESKVTTTLAITLAIASLVLAALLIGASLLFFDQLENM